MDDILRYIPINAVTGAWEVSWDGRSDWQTLHIMTWPSALESLRPAYGVRRFVGRFDSAPGVDLLAVDFSRMGRIYGTSSAAFVTHSLFAY
jgi:hypothetical protein